MQRLSKWLAYYKAGTVLSKTETHAHALVGKWEKFQKEYKNRIKHFLPRVGDHPAVTVEGVVTEWDAKSKATNQGKDMQVPVDFPPDIVKPYDEFNKEYVPQSPIKQAEAELLLDILPLDIRYLLGCGYEWKAAEEATEDPSASGGLEGASSQAATADPPADPKDTDKSRSPSPALDPNDFVKWDLLAPESIPFDKIALHGDINLTTNRSYHAAAIVFFVDPVRGLQWPEKKDSLHAGWMATFKHPMNFEELKRPPCVGETAYTDEEQNWCAASLQYYVDGMDAARRATLGIPESAVTKRRSGRPAAGGASGGDGRVESSPAGGASGGAGRAGKSASGGKSASVVRARGGAAAAPAPAADGRRVAGGGAAEGSDTSGEEDETCASSQIPSRKRSRGQRRQAHFLLFSVHFEYLCA